MWKTWGGRCIYRSLSGNIRVYQNRWYRWLTFESAPIQTLIHRRAPEKPGLGYVRYLTLAARQQPGASCLLGLGGAGVAHALAPVLPHCTLSIVEHSAEVIEVANTFFMTNTLPNLTIICQDAQVFVQNETAHYQHVLMDLFGAHEFPAHCRTHDFFAHCHRMLQPGGVFAANLLSVNGSWPEWELIREVFGTSTVAIPVKGSGNLVVLAIKSQTITPLLNLIDSSRQCKTIHWDPQWGYVAY